MSNKVKLVLINEVQCKFDGIDVCDRRKLSNVFKYEIPGARFTPSVRLGRWDGKIGFFSVGGTTFINLLPEILGHLGDKYDIEVVDNRQQFNMTFDSVDQDSYSHMVWPVGHEMAGKPIILRDYQVMIINNYLTNPQSVQEIATGAGKCITYDSKLNLVISNALPFGQFIINKLDNGMVRIGELADAISTYKNIQLMDDIEVDIKDLGCQINTPSGLATINYIIKKEGLSGRKFILSNNIEIKCANNHILQYNDKSIYAGTLDVGDFVQTSIGQFEIINTEPITDTTFYDIGIDYPHIYYDFNNVLHHNTLITAILSHKCEDYGRTFVIVPNRSLVTQTLEDYQNLGLDVGVYFGGKKEFDKTHTICTWQSLNSLIKSTRAGKAPIDFNTLIDGVSAVIADECHTAKADVLKNLLTQSLGHVPVRWGLTGTIPKEDFAAKSILVSIGDVTNKISTSELQEKGVLANCNVNIKQLIDHGEYKTYQEELKYIVTNPARIEYIADMISQIKDSGNTLVLVDRIKTGEMLLEKLIELGIDESKVVFISGSVKDAKRKEAYDDVKTIDNKIILATYGVASVGINIIRLYNLVLIEPGKSFVRVMQSIGRGLRKGSDKNHIEVYDICSNLKFSKRHLTKRKRFYSDGNLQYQIEKINH